MIINAQFKSQRIITYFVIKCRFVLSTSAIDFNSRLPFTCIWLNVELWTFSPLATHIDLSIKFKKPSGLVLHSFIHGHKNDRSNYMLLVTCSKSHVSVDVSNVTTIPFSESQLFFFCYHLSRLQMSSVQTSKKKNYPENEMSERRTYVVHERSSAFRVNLSLNGCRLIIQMESFGRRQIL